MKKFLTLALLFLPLLCQGADGDPIRRQQVRVGWGDMLFETMAFYPGLSATGLEKYDFGSPGPQLEAYSYIV